MTPTGFYPLNQYHLWLTCPDRNARLSDAAGDLLAGLKAMMAHETRDISIKINKDIA